MLALGGDILSFSSCVHCLRINVAAGNDANTASERPTNEGTTGVVDSVTTGDIQATDDVTTQLPIAAPSDHSDSTDGITASVMSSMTSASVTSGNTIINRLIRK